MAVCSPIKSYAHLVCFFAYFTERNRLLFIFRNSLITAISAFIIRQVKAQFMAPVKTIVARGKRVLKLIIITEASRTSSSKGEF